MSGFPANVIPELVTSLETHMEPIEVTTVNGTTEFDASFLKRPLIPTDENRSVGIHALDWTPIGNSLEIGSNVPGQPTLSRYAYSIESWFKHSNREECQRISAYDAKVIRSILYRDPALRVRLLSLVDTVLSSTERIHKYGIARQRFVQNKLSGTFVSLSVTDFWIETETIAVP